MRKRIATLLLLILATPAQAEGLPQQTKDELIALAMQHFWGNAVGVNGHKLIPLNEKERTSLPIAKEEAGRVVEIGMLSGLASWCKVNWQERYMLFMQDERGKGGSEKQVAFIGMLHGITQGFILKGAGENVCSKEQKEKIAQAVGRDVAALKQRVK